MTYIFMGLLIYGVTIYGVVTRGVSCGKHYLSTSVKSWQPVYLEYNTQM